MMESESNYLNNLDRPLTKKERFPLILQALQQNPPAQNAHEAYEMITKVFTEIQDKYPPPPGFSGFMGVVAFKHMRAIRYEKKTVKYYLYTNHILFIAENGAIQMLYKKGDSEGFNLSDFGTPPFKNLSVTFEKPGSDGRGVWDELTS